MATKAGQRLTTKEEGALFGLALKDRDTWKALVGVGAEFSHGPLNEVYKVAQTWAERHGRAPNRIELEEAVKLTYGAEAAGHLYTIKGASELSGQYGADILKKRLKDWAKAAVLKKRAEKVMETFNDGDVEATAKAWKSGAAELDAIDAAAGATDAMRASPDRMDEEAAGRAANEGRHLEYGVSFLDDCLGGLLREQFIMVGADTGVGKTDFARQVALHNAAKGKVVHAFFLEAANGEIEKRTKFPLLMKMAAEDGILLDPRKFNYVNWLKNNCKELDKYNKKVDEEYRAKYPNFHTYYRNDSGFNAEDLKRAMLVARLDADLFIVDHLQYVDLDSGESENTEITKLVMSIRETIQATGVPVLCISHLKKSGRADTILPDLPDFHGSSNITKVATTCVMLARFRDEQTRVEGSPEGSPTLIQAVKYRDDAERSEVAGICYYRRDDRHYDNKYAIGHLVGARGKWKPLNKIPVWWPNQETNLLFVTEEGDIGEK